MHKTSVEVRYGETDKMGIVYHANYFNWFDVARNKWSKDNDVEYFGLEKQGIMMPLIQCDCKFIKSAVFGDMVVVETSLTQLSIVRCRFDYKVFRESDKELLATGFTVHAFTDVKQKPLNLKKRYPKVFRTFELSVE